MCLDVHTYYYVLCTWLIQSAGGQCMASPGQMDSFWVCGLVLVWLSCHPVVTESLQDTFFGSMKYLSWVPVYSDTEPDHIELYGATTWTKGYIVSQLPCDWWTTALLNMSSSQLWMKVINDDSLPCTIALCLCLDFLFISLVMRCIIQYTFADNNSMYAGMQLQLPDDNSPLYLLPL
jgi:hypothetical protein